MNYLANAAPTVVDIQFVRGDSLTVEMGLVTEAGDPADVSGFTVASTAVGCKGGLVTTMSASRIGSTITLSLTAEQTAAMDQFSDYDVQFDQIGGGERVTPIAGKIQILPEFTTN